MIFKCRMLQKCTMLLQLIEKDISETGFSLMFLEQRFHYFVREVKKLISDFSMMCSCAKIQIDPANQ